MPSKNPLLRARWRAPALPGGLCAAAVLLSACGGSDDDGDTPTTPAPKGLSFAAVAKNKEDRVTVPAGYEVSILHALGDPLTSTDAVWADNGSESADS